MKTPPLLEEALRAGKSISGMFLTPEYFYLKRPKEKPCFIRQSFDVQTQEWVDVDPDRFKTPDYRRIALVLYTQYDVRINDIASFLKIGVPAANAHATGAGAVAYSKK